MVASLRGGGEDGNDSSETIMKGLIDRMARTLSAINTRWFQWKREYYERFFERYFFFLCFILSEKGPDSCILRVLLQLSTDNFLKQLTILAFVCRYEATAPTCNRTQVHKEFSLRCRMIYF